MNISNFLSTVIVAASLTAGCATSTYAYTPSPEVIKSQQDFENDRFGIFIHWGIYSMFAQGEWYLNYGPTAEEYAKAASGFYPANFDASQWAEAIKNSGAEYICFTSRHHDSFSMFDTEMSDYNIVDATPFKRDVLKELSEACRDKDLSLHLYYSHLDWTRPEYPQGRTGHTTGRDASLADWDKYYAFMNGQLKELLTNYGPIRVIWFDGWWDHDEDAEPFDWHLQEQYEMIHDLQPGCLVANNHHQTPFEGEDIQIFERDLPGQNTYGLSGQSVSRLPLETCNTMNGMWGYKIKDQNYKDVPTLVRYLVHTAGLGANLLLNIGPQPDGSLPATALERLKGIGEWMNTYGTTIKGTKGAPFAEQPWGTATVKGKTMFVHITDPTSHDIVVPFTGKVNKAHEFVTGKKVKFTQTDKSVILHLDEIPEDIDHVIELTLAQPV